MRSPDQRTISAWTALLTTSRVLLERVEAALKQEGLPPLAWYDALLEIERAGPGGIRPFELKEMLLLPQYGTSRLLDRIAKAGLIDRATDPADGRGQRIFITESGRAMRRRMWPVYARFLSDEVEARLGPHEMKTLESCLRRLRG